jgi:hypothetical protein
MTSIMARQIMGLVVGRQPLVVPGRAAVPGGPRQGPLDDPPAGQYLEGVEVIGRLRICMVSLRAFSAR